GHVAFAMDRGAIMECVESAASGDRVEVVRHAAVSVFLRDRVAVGDQLDHGGVNHLIIGQAIGGGVEPGDDVIDHGAIVGSLAREQAEGNSHRSTYSGSGL